MSLALRKYLDCQAECTKDPMITFRFVECWTQLVSLVIENVIGNDALVSISPPFYFLVCN